MKSLELKELRSDTISKLEAIQIAAENEKRELNADETTEVDSLLQKCDDFDVKIKRAEKIEKELRNAASISGEVVKSSTDIDVAKYSFFKHIRGVLGGNLDGIEAEVQQEANVEARGVGKSISGIGIPSKMMEKRADVTSDIAGTSVEAYVGALREESVYDRAGCTI